MQQARRSAEAIMMFSECDDAEAAVLLPVALYSLIHIQASGESFTADM
jgi:hypothetical protein